MTKRNRYKKKRTSRKKQRGGTTSPHVNTWGYSNGSNKSNRSYRSNGSNRSNRSNGSNGSNGSNRSNDSSFKTPKKNEEPKVDIKPIKRAQTAEELYEHAMSKLSDNVEINSLVADKSLNGTLYKIKNKKDKDNDWKFILKLSQDNQGNYFTDSLPYEFSVGMFLNKQRMYFPCFLQTHTLLEFGITDSGHASKTLLHKFIKNKSLMTDETMKKKLENILSSINQTDKNILNERACENKDNYGILLDYVEGKTLYSIQDNLEEQETYHILFQIYAVLYALTGEYSHNDLHAKNVMIYEKTDTVFRFTYENVQITDENEIITPKDISFTSKYLVKIIDYGRGIIPEMEPIIDNYNNDYNELNKLKETLEHTKDKKSFHTNYKEYLKIKRNLEITQHNLQLCGLSHLLTENDDLKLFPGARNLSYAVNTLYAFIEEGLKPAQPSSQNVIQITVDANILPAIRKKIDIEPFNEDIVSFIANVDPKNAMPDGTTLFTDNDNLPLPPLPPPPPPPPPPP